MEEIIELRSPEEALALYGHYDENLRTLKDLFQIHIVARNEALKLIGERKAVRGAREAVDRLLDGIREGRAQDPAVLSRILGAKAPASKPSGREFSARSQGQERYLDLIDTHEIVFGLGPAGTGKTFLAVLQAVRYLRRGDVQRIILVRPAVEAGEHLGFLPGDFQAKINPYLRPLYDALNEILDHDTVRKFMEEDIIEIIPLAYMRGRTLNRAFIILDEAQNTTIAQMKMFLTRMGEGSRVVVTGDPTQVDLPPNRECGVVHAERILKGTDGIGFHSMTKKDIVRHPLVWKIINAYECEKPAAKPVDSHHPRQHLKSRRLRAPRE